MTATFLYTWDMTTDLCWRHPIPMSYSQTQKHVAAMTGAEEQLDESPVTGYVRFCDGMIVLFLFDEETECELAEENRDSVVNCAGQEWRVFA